MIAFSQVFPTRRIYPPRPDGLSVSPHDPQKRKAAVWLLRRGVLTVGEIAQALDVTRQVARYWANTSGFDYRARRKQFVRRICDQAMKIGRR